MSVINVGEFTKGTVESMSKVACKDAQQIFEG